MVSIDLSGKTALVTGGSGQLGRVMVRRLAQAGAAVLVHYNQNGEKAAALVRELEAAGTRAAAVQADVTDFESVLHMRDEAARFGSPDIVVNNAVIQYAWKDVMEQDPQDFYSQFASTVMHNAYMFKAFAPAMLKRGAGKFIVINTECAMRCDPGAAAYSSAKRGLDGLCRSFAKEVGSRGVTVNQVAPGWMITERERAAGAVTSGAYVESVPMGRRGCDADIADAVLFFASGLSDYITGAFLSVSGGRVMPTI